MRTRWMERSSRSATSGWPSQVLQASLSRLAVTGLGSPSAASPFSRLLASSFWNPSTNSCPTSIVAVLRASQSLLFATRTLYRPLLRPQVEQRASDHQLHQVRQPWPSNLALTSVRSLHSRLGKACSDDKARHADSSHPWRTLLTAWNHA